MVYDGNGTATTSGIFDTDSFCLMCSMLADSTTTYEALRTRLEPYQQEHLLQFWDDLSDQEREKLREQIEGLDLDLLSTLIAGQHAEEDFAALAASANKP